MQRRRWFTWLAGLLLIGCLGTIGHAQAQIPFRLHYQGKLAKTDGTLVDGPGFVVSFTLYDAPVGGAQLWSQTFTGVEINKGVFHVLLGTDDPFSPINLGKLPWDKAYYLEVGIPQYVQTTDRTVIVSVPFSFRAQDANTVGGRYANGTPNNLPVLDAQGKLPGGLLQDKTVTTQQLADEAVTTGKIKPLAVGTTQIADQAVDGSKITPLSISTGLIGDNQVITSKLDTNAVTSNRIKDGEVKTEDIASGAVTNDRISGVDAGKINSGQIQNGQIADNAITGNKIADGAATARKARLGNWTTGIIGGGWTYSDFVGGSYWTETPVPNASLTISLETTSVVFMFFKCTIALKSGDRGNPDFVCYVDGQAVWGAQAQVADSGWEGSRTSPVGFHLQALGAGTHTLQMKVNGYGQNFKMWNAELSAFAFAQ